jgi:hypothetical protein
MASKIQCSHVGSKSSSNAGQVFEQPKPNGQEKEIAELERIIGRLTIQLDMAKKVLGYSGFPPKENE